MEKEKTTRWFIRPRDEDTSKAIALMLDLGPSAEMEKVPVAPGKTLRMWEAKEYSEIDFAEKSKSEGNYDFQSYRWKPDEQFAQKWPFGQPKRLARTRKVKQARKGLSEEVHILLKETGKVILSLEGYDATFIGRSDFKGIRMISWQRDSRITDHNIPEMVRRALYRVAFIELGRQQKTARDRARKMFKKDSSRQLSFSF